MGLLSNDETRKFWLHKKKPFAIALGRAFILIQLLVIGVVSYLYGSVYNAQSRIHNFPVLFVNYDNGVVGDAVYQAGLSLQSEGFPQMVKQDPSSYPDEASLIAAVRQGHYWAALYVQANSTDRLAAAIGDETIAAQYNPNNTLKYITNSARYASATVGDVDANVDIWYSVAISVYNNMNGTKAVATLPPNSMHAAAVLLHPWTPQTYDIMATDQDQKFFYNTVTMVLPVLMQFFFILGMNGITIGFKLYSQLPVLNNVVLRIGISLLYSFCGGLGEAGYIWAFRGSWNVDGVQFFLTWMTLWLWQHVNFLVAHNFTTFIPMKFMPFCIFPWVVINVTSTIFPFEMSPGFYQWAYALPQHEAYQILIQVWSRGADNHLAYALPILFIWQWAMLLLAIYGIRRNCLMARAEAEQAAGGPSEPKGPPAPAPSSTAASTHADAEKALEIEKGLRSSEQTPPAKFTVVRSQVPMAPGQAHTAGSTPPTAWPVSGNRWPGSPNAPNARRSARFSTAAASNRRSSFFRPASIDERYVDEDTLDQLSQTYDQLTGGAQDTGPNRRSMRRSIPRRWSGMRPASMDERSWLQIDR